MRFITYGRERDNKIVMDALSHYPTFVYKLRRFSYADELVEQTVRSGMEYAVELAVPEPGSVLLRKLPTIKEEVAGVLDAFGAGDMRALPPLAAYLQEWKRHYAGVRGERHRDFRTLCADLLLGSEIHGETCSRIVDIFRSFLAEGASVRTEAHSDRLMGTVHVHAHGDAVSATDKHGYSGIPVYVIRYCAGTNGSQIQAYHEDDVYDVGELAHHPRLRKLERELNRPRLWREGEDIRIEDDAGLAWFAVGSVLDDGIPIAFGSVQGPRTRIKANYPRMLALAFNRRGKYASYIESD